MYDDLFDDELYSDQSNWLTVDSEIGMTGLHLLLFQSIDLHFNIFLLAILNLFSHLWSGLADLKAFA